MFWHIGLMWLGCKQPQEIFMMIYVQTCWIHYISWDKMKLRKWGWSCYSPMYIQYWCVKKKYMLINNKVIIRKLGYFIGIWTFINNVVIFNLSVHSTCTCKIQRTGKIGCQVDTNALHVLITQIQSTLKCNSSKRPSILSNFFSV